MFDIGLIPFLRPVSPSGISPSGVEAQLTAGEQEELYVLLDESQERMLQLTLSVMASGSRKRGNGKRRSKSGK